MNKFKKYETLENECMNENIIYVSNDELYPHGLHIIDDNEYFTLHSSPYITSLNRIDQFGLVEFIKDEIRKFESNGLKLLQNNKADSYENFIIKEYNNCNESYNNPVASELYDSFNNDLTYGTILKNLNQFGKVADYYRKYKNNTIIIVKCEENKKEDEFKKDTNNYFFFTGYALFKGISLRFERNKSSIRFFENEYKKYTKTLSKNIKKTLKIDVSDLTEWADNVKSIDECVCKVCGSTFKPHAHHIYPKSKYSDLAWDVNNGVTLCKYCHLEYHDRFNIDEVNPRTLIEFITKKLTDKW